MLMSNGKSAAECGLFDIAFAVCLCNSLDPHTVGFDQSKMRCHFVASIERDSPSQSPYDQAELNSHVDFRGIRKT